MSKPVTVARDGNVAVITLDNPPVNALSFHLRKPLNEAMETLRDDADVAAIVIACAGRTFIAGADITEFGKPMQHPSLPDLIATLETIDKPTVAAIHGTALGGGLELALGCHFRVADRKARLGLPEVKLGLLPGAGGTQRLPRAVGKAKAMDMCLTGRMMPADEAERAGLVSRVVPADELMETAMEAASAIASKSLPIAMMTKEAVNMAFEMGLNEGVRFERRVFQSQFATEDQSEGMAAFADKRAAHFKHR